MIKKKKRLRPDFVFLRYHLFGHVFYGSLPFYVVVGDLNNDRKLDFAVTKEDTDN